MCIPHAIEANMFTLMKNHGKQTGLEKLKKQTKVDHFPRTPI